MYTLDRLAEQGRDGQLFQFAALPVLVQAYRVRDDQAVQYGILHLLHGVPGKQSVGAGRVNRFRSVLLQGLGRSGQAAPGVDHVVADDHVLPFHFADHVDDLGHVGPRPPLVHQRQGAVQPPAVGPGHGHAPRVGGGDHEVFRRPQFPEAPRKHGRGIQMIQGDVEEPLDLRRVQVHRQYAVRPGRGDQVRDDLRRNGHPGPRLPVLPGIAVIGDHRGGPSRRSPLGRVQQQQQLEEVLRRGIGRLDHEYVGPPDVLVDVYTDLFVAEARNGGLAQGYAEIFADVICKRCV